MAFSMRKLPQETISRKETEIQKASGKQHAEQQLLLLVDEQASLIDEQTEKIHFLTDQMEDLKQKLQSANKQIEQLAGSDIELQQSQRNKAEALKALKLAEEKLNHAQQLREETETKQSAVEKDKANIHCLIEKRAREAADVRIAEYTKVQDEALRKLQQKERLYSPYLFIILSYSVLVTWFVAISSTEYLEAWKVFGESIWELVLTIWSGLLRAAMWAAQLSQYVPNADCASVVHWLIFAGVLSGAAFAVFTLIRKFGKRGIQFAQRHLTDRISILIYLGAAAVSVFFAGSMQAVMHINPIWMSVILSAGYVLVRCVYIAYRSV